MMSLVIVISGLSSCLLTYFIWSFTRSSGLLDIPNERSSHTIPTPRAGGVAIVSVATAGFLYLARIHWLDSKLLAALMGGLVVAVIGLIDDRRSISASLRVAAHFGAALWALAWLGGVPSQRVGQSLVTFGGFGYVVGTLGIVWTLNLFNFMDGIDGIAASEATLVAWAGALLMAGALGSASVLPASLFGIGLPPGYSWATWVADTLAM